MDFTGKIILITGAGNGIGRAAALGFATRGGTVVVVDHDQAAGEATAGIIRQQGGTSSFTRADVTKSADVQAYVKYCVDTYGGIDCFYNNAGIEGSVAPTAEYDEDMFDRVMAVNVKGVFLGMRHVLPVMIRQGRGSVVNTASVAGLVASPGMPAYVASKHAVIGLTKTAAMEYARDNIRVNCVNPGYITTPMTEETVRSRYDALMAKVPMHRMGLPEEIAEAVVWMCSDKASFMTGASHVVAGGDYAA